MLGWHVLQACDHECSVVFPAGVGLFHDWRRYVLCVLADAVHAVTLLSMHAGNLPAKNNRLDNFWYAVNTVAAPQNNCPSFNCTVDAATVYKVAGSTWPAQAQAIMNGAGART